VSDSEIGACLSAAAARPEALAGSDRGSRLRHLVDELSKAPRTRSRSERCLLTCRPLLPLWMLLLTQPSVPWRQPGPLLRLQRPRQRARPSAAGTAAACPRMWEEVATVDAALQLPPSLSEGDAKGLALRKGSAGGSRQDAGHQVSRAHHVVRLLRCADCVCVPSGCLSGCAYVIPVIEDCFNTTRPSGLTAHTVACAESANHLSGLTGYVRVLCSSDLAVQS